MIVYVTIGIVTLLAIAGLFFIDNAFDRIFGWLFRKAGLQSGNGPLMVGSRAQGEKFILSLENQGTDSLMLAAVEGRDRDQKKCYPLPCLKKEDFRAGGTKGARFKQFAGIVLQPGEERPVILDLDELAALGCLTLTVLDQRGNKWPVCDFGSNESKKS